MSEDRNVSTSKSGLLSRRMFFLAVSVSLLLLTTDRFTGDVWAFSWSLIVIAGVMYLDR